MQQCNTYSYIVINVVHNQSPRRIPNSAHIPGFREAILVTVIKHDLPDIYPTGSHTLGSLSSHHTHWELSGLLTGLVDRLQGGPYLGSFLLWRNNDIASLPELCGKTSLISMVSSDRKYCRISSLRSPNTEPESSHTQKKRKTFLSYSRNCFRVSKDS